MDGAAHSGEDGGAGEDAFLLLRRPSFLYFRRARTAGTWLAHFRPWGSCSGSSPMQFSPFDLHSPFLPVVYGAPVGWTLPLSSIIFVFFP